MSKYIEEVFGPKGLLAQKFENYSPRSGQIEMAHAVDSALKNEHHLMVEAPTGTGKSLAYAVPAIQYADKERDQRAVIATANIPLQEQLVKKDLPFLQEVLPKKFSFALMKGRNNYLCSYRKAETIAKGALALDPKLRAQEEKIIEWAGKTKTGDKSELDFEPAPAVWRKFSSTSDTCLDDKCRCECFYQKARSATDEADVIVTNYHQLFAHVQVKQWTGKCITLPEHAYVIMDEAHRAAEIARDFFGTRLTVGSFVRAASYLKELERDDLRQNIVYEAERFFDRLEEYRRSPEYKRRIKKENVVTWWKLYKYVGEAAALCEPGKKDDPDTKKDKQRAQNRLRSVSEKLFDCMTLNSPDGVVFLEEGEKRPVLCSKSLIVSNYLRKGLFDEVKSAVLTSATLCVNNSFDFIKEETGLPEPKLLEVESPFDHWSCSAVFIPSTMPMPTDPTYPMEVAKTVGDIIDIVGGRTLALFTSWQRLHLTYDWLRNKPYRILKQGDMPRTALIKEFREDVSSVLLGTESFWAGVDVPGESLSCVIIDRLPFPTPDDPVLDAMTARDKKTFHKYCVPKAAIAFKQGAGRLIRSKDDHGVIAVLDRRVVDKAYGRTMLFSLPGMPIKDGELPFIKQFLAKADPRLCEPGLNATANPVFEEARTSAPTMGL